MSDHATLTGASLHSTKVDRAASAFGQPSATPSFAGQESFDSDGRQLWIALATSGTTDWKRVIGAGFTAVVHSTAGIGTHTTLAAVIADSNVPAGSRVLVLSDQSVSATIAVNKRLHIVFAPGVTVGVDTTSGALAAFTISVDNCCIEFARVNRSAGANVLTGFSITGSGTKGNRVLWPTYSSSVGTQYSDASTALNNMHFGEIQE